MEADLVLKLDTTREQVIATRPDAQVITVPVVWDPQEWLLVLTRAANAIGNSVEIFHREILGPSGSLLTPSAWVWTEVWDLACAPLHVFARMQLVMHRSDWKKPVYLYQYRVTPQAKITAELRAQFAKAQAAVSELLAFSRRRSVPGLILDETSEGTTNVVLDGNVIGVAESNIEGVRMADVVRKALGVKNA